MARGDSGLDQWREEDPDAPGPAEARTKGEGAPIWALVGHLPAVDNDPVWLAAEYRLPEAAVTAALHYYTLHRDMIDDRIAANAVPVG